ncbi:MAG: hypothetical protein ACFFE8_06235 [Candidatus Heimdallarchaeota archaeon]
MNNQIDLKKIEQSTYNELMIDGITEILAGILLLATPLFFRLPFIVVFVPFLIFYGRYGLDFIRERTTYPRIGRVVLIREEEKEGYSTKKALLTFLILIAGAILITFLVMIMVEKETSDMQLIVEYGALFFGLVMFGPSLYLVENTGQTRYYLLGIIATLLGFLFSIFKFIEGYDNIILYFVTLGVIALLVGIIRYFLFIRRYPVVTTEGEED